MSKIIDRFSGEYRFLSNFFSVKIDFAGIVYPSIEHAYQAMKTLHVPTREFISTIDTAGMAKQYGKTLNLRNDWEDVKLQIMLDLLMIKFSKPTFKLRLLQTGDALLVEGNTWGDTFWGVCRGVGHNHLGKHLMHVREILKNG